MRQNWWKVSQSVFEEFGHKCGVEKGVRYVRSSREVKTEG